MKRQIRLNEKQLGNVVKRIVKESMLNLDDLDGIKHTNPEEYEDDITYDDWKDGQKANGQQLNEDDSYLKLRKLAVSIVEHLSEEEQIFLLEQVNHNSWDVIYALVGALNNRY